RRSRWPGPGPASAPPARADPGRLHRARRRRGSCDQPEALQHLDHARGGPRAFAQDLDGALLLDRDAEPDRGTLPGRPRRLDPVDLLLACTQPARDGRVARQVETLADRDDRPPRALVNLPAP